MKRSELDRRVREELQVRCQHMLDDLWHVVNDDDGLFDIDSKEGQQQVVDQMVESSGLEYLVRSRIVARIHAVGDSVTNG